MNQFYSLFKKKATVLTMSLGLFAGLDGFSQASVCGGIAETFNGGNMAGFTSSTVNSTAAGFTIGQTGQNGYLQRCNIQAGGAVFEITTPTYQTFASQQSVGYGFELDGAVKVSRVVTMLQYIANDGTVTTVEVANFAPSYNGPNPGDIAAECRALAIASYNGFTPGDRYRFIFQLTASSASNQNQCITFDNFRTTGTSAAAPLPVSFTGISFQKQSTGINVIWNIAGEYDVARYEVERSNDGRNFVKLGEVTPNAKAAYSFNDNQPISGVAFYRVRNVDLDGSYSFSNILRVNNSRSITLKAFPLPARNEVTIEHGAASKGFIAIAGADGQTIRRIAVKPDVTQTVIDVSTLKAGMYLARFDDGQGNVETVKMIKQ